MASSTLAFSGAQKRAELLRNPCILGGPQRQARGENQKRLPHPCLLGGRTCYITPAFLGGPQHRGENQKWLPQPRLLGGPKEGGIATKPVHSWESLTGFKWGSIKALTALVEKRGVPKGGP